MTNEERAHVLNASTTNAEAAAVLGMTLGSVRVLAARLRRAGFQVVHKRDGRPKKPR